MIPKPQIELLRTLQRSGPVPMFPMGYGAGSLRLTRRELSKTDFVEQFVGKDGTTWLRMAPAGRTLLEIIDKMPKRRRPDRTA